MQNKFNQNAVVFTITLLFVVLALAPAINSLSVKNFEKEKHGDVDIVFDSLAISGDDITYDVYFGTTSPPPKVAGNQSETSYNPGTLDYNTTYYWQIVAWNEQGESAESPIWHFTTEIVLLSVETLDADPVGKYNVTLHGKILEDGGEQCQVRFRYRELNETTWDYPSDWHGSYATNETFSEYVDGLNISTIYEFQAGAKNSQGENWGELKNFTTDENQLPVPIIAAPSTGYKTGVEFDGSDSYDPDGNITDYYWDFDDGTNGSGEIITHYYEESGTYTVSLEVTDNDGATNVTTHQITIENRAPTASIETDDDDNIININDTVNFDGTGSSDPDGDDLTYEWKIGGEIVGTDPIMNYTFTESGDYIVLLTVTDDDANNPLSDSMQITIHVNSPPIADFTMDPEPPIYFGTTIEFNGSESYDPDGDIVNYTWYFEDTPEDPYAYGEVVYHTFNYGGDWTVTLTVTDDDGATDEHSEIVEVLYRYEVDCSNSHSHVKNKISIKQANIDSNSDYKITKETLDGYPPKIPSDPHPKDGATNVSIDVVLSWTGGEDNPPYPPVITGKIHGKVGVEYQYNFSLSDPDDDAMYLRVDWGNGTPGPWQGPYNSGTTVRLNHTWNEKGTFTIRAQVKDIYGAESEWGTLEVVIPKNRNMQLFRFLEKYPFLQKVLNFIRWYN